MDRKSMRQPGSGGELEDVLARILQGSRVVVAGGGERAQRLAGRSPDVFVADLPADAPQGAYDVLALGGDEESLRRAAALARAAGAARVLVVVDRDAGDGAPAEAPLSEPVRNRLHEAGLALAGAERVLFRPADPLRSSAATRLERLEEETRAVLLRCVVRDHPRALAELEEAVASLQRQLDLYAQLAIDHARTRDVERERADRLARLEERLGSEPARRLADEVDLLREEIARMKATRVWRVGTSYWRLRDRLLRGGRAG